MENNKNESFNRKNPSLSTSAFFAATVNEEVTKSTNQHVASDHHHQSSAPSTTSTEGMLKQLFCGGIAGAVAK
jgi:hypothetical protein